MRLSHCLHGNHFSNQYRPFPPEIGVLLERTKHFSLSKRCGNIQKSEHFPPLRRGTLIRLPPPQNRRNPAQIADPPTRPNQPPSSEAQIRNHIPPQNTQQHQVRAGVRAITCCRSPCRADPSAAAPTPRGPRPRRRPPPRPPWCRPRGVRAQTAALLPPPGPPLLLTSARRRNLLGPRRRRPHTSPSLSLEASPRSSLARSRRQSVRSCAFERGSRPGAGGAVGCLWGRRGAHLR